MTRLTAYDLVQHLAEQRDWFEQTFGPGTARDKAPQLIKHIRKELDEIEADPMNRVEWLDVVILAFEGALRTGTPPTEVAAALRDKMAQNRARTWPAPGSVAAGEPIEHVREDGE